MDPRSRALLQPNMRSGAPRLINSGIEIQILHITGASKPHLDLLLLLGPPLWRNKNPILSLDECAVKLKIVEGLSTIAARARRVGFRSNDDQGGFPVLPNRPQPNPNNRSRRCSLGRLLSRLKTANC